MSYMRTPIYVWGSVEKIHIWVRDDTAEKDAYVDPPPDEVDGYNMAGGVAIDYRLFDAIVLMRHAELLADPKQMKRAVKRAKKEAGNFGSWALLEALGEDPGGKFRERMEAVDDPDPSSPGVLAGPGADGRRPESGR